MGVLTLTSLRRVPGFRESCHRCRARRLAAGSQSRPTDFPLPSMRKTLSSGPLLVVIAIGGVSGLWQLLGSVHDAGNPWVIRSAIRERYRSLIRWLVSHAATAMAAGGNQESLTRFLSEPPRGDTGSSIDETGSADDSRCNGRREPPPTLPLLPDLKNNRYSIQSEHARGGLGRILVAQDVRLDRPVA